MIQAVLTRLKNGELHSCSLSGHSGFAVSGKDIVCAAVSVLARTALDVLRNQSGIGLATTVSARGMLSFRVEEKEGSGSGILTYTADFLQSGFVSLQQEYPANISVRLLLADKNNTQ